MRFLGPKGVFGMKGMEKVRFFGVMCLSLVTYMVSVRKTIRE